MSDGRIIFVRGAALMTAGAAAAMCLGLPVPASAAGGAAQGKKAPQKGAPAAGAAAPKLTTTEFPDGTGTIGLPEGWKIDGSYRGSVGCKGPNGAGVLMGFPWVIQDPNHGVSEIPIPTGSPIVPVGDLAGALRGVLEKNGAKLTSLRSRPAPSPKPGVPAAFFLYEYEQGGKTLAALGYFSMVEHTPGSPYWQLYSSAVTAPKERFMRDLPAMVAVYNSWRPNGQRPRPGSDGAMIDAAKEAGERAHAESIKSMQESFERMQAKYKEVL